MQLKKKRKKEIADIKLTYRAYANLEKRIPQAIDPEYLRILEYDNIDVVLDELKRKQEQKRVDELKKTVPEASTEIIQDANITHEDYEAEKRKKRNKRNIGWSLVDD